MLHFSESSSANEAQEKVTEHDLRAKCARNASTLERARAPRHTQITG